jgi:hypothetical protein
MAGQTLHVQPRPPGVLDEIETLARRGITRRITDPSARGDILAALGLDKPATVAPGLCGCGCGSQLGPADIAKGGGTRVRCQGRGAA